ncbi:MAG: glycosyltransferase family 4 protein, partial [SAR202 cluster bacterium]|nr:glycosyltransferase family 4 protein [SAR202 cluster bacterium]
MSKTTSHQDMKRLRVLMLTPKTYWVGKRNSDIRTYPLLKNLLEKSHALEMNISESLLLTLQANASYAAAAALWRTQLPKSVDAFASLWHLTRRACWLPKGVIRQHQPDVAYTVLLYPMNRIPIPLVLDFDFNPWGIPTMRAEVDRLRYIPRWMLERAAVIVVRHEVSLEALKERFPDQAQKGIVVPTPLPGLEALEDERVRAKFHAFGAPSIKVVFVGNQAVVKGMPELIQACQTLKPRYPVDLTVVSRFVDGTVEVPPGVRVLSDLPSAEVYRLMAESHIFVMPTKRDSHGRVFWEAMANGCAIVAPCFTPHQELFAEFGATADPRSPEAIAGALESLISNPGVCLER